ncbi:hypothetical protein BLA28_20175 [Eisenbergiella tayi]|uniref:hypothetical protein n=1 Tax=Eisenbergiella tayi TaxID=1432052 RepID=UPI0008FCF8B8|nr:hypothetical protein [Eisenbergiella tayi]OIZ62714.1 hypothetical protein BLA28_20175 [Eisenbergiella tayi]
MGKNTGAFMDKDSGFHVMVNMYIIRYLFSHMEKDSIFYKTGGKRKTNIDFYESIVAGISRDRIQKMFRGENFGISMEEKERLEEKFHISRTYFEKNGTMIEINTLDETDWKCLFHVRHYAGYPLKLAEKAMEDRADKVIRVLNGLLKKGVIENTYDTESPLYRVWYYFHKGYAFMEESRMARFLKELEKLEIKDWDEIIGNMVKLEHYRELLSKHCEYINAVTAVRKMREN